MQTNQCQRVRQFSKVERFLHNLLLEKRYKRRGKNHINRKKLFLLGLAVSPPRSRDTHWQEYKLCHRRLGKENFKGSSVERGFRS